MRRRMICADQFSPHQTSLSYRNGNDSSFTAVHLDTVHYFLKKENTAHEQCSRLRCSLPRNATLFDIRGVLSALCFVCHSFFQLTHGPSHTLPSVIAQRYCVASFFLIVLSALTQCKLYLTVQQGWILRTSLALTVNAAAFNPSRVCSGR